MKGPEFDGDVNVAVADHARKVGVGALGVDLEVVALTQRARAECLVDRATGALVAFLFGIRRFADPA